MGVGKASVGGNSFIGAFAIATDSFSLIGSSVGNKTESMISELLGVRPVRAAIDGSDLIGVYAVANSNCILLPEIAGETEVQNLKRELGGVRIERIRTDLNALGNNILANDRIAIVNPDYRPDEMKRIGDALGVEVLKLELGGSPTVGASNILTNSGMVLNNRSSDADLEVVKRYMKNYSQSTANLGSLSIRLSAIANSKGLLVGDETTGFEMARIAEGLGI